MSKNVNQNQNVSIDKPARGRWLKGLSIVGSIGVILWSFSTVLNKSSLATPKVASGSVKPVDPVEKVTRQQPDSHEFRDAAIELDQAFMASLLKDREESLAQSKPGIDEVAPIWKRRVDRMRLELDSLAGAEEGTMEWANRQSLLTKMEDLPQ